MHSRFGKWMVVAAAGATFCLLAVMPTPAQAPAYKAPKTKDGKPDLNGIWQAMNEANWDIRPHAASQGPVYSLGAAYSVPASPRNPRLSRLGPVEDRVDRVGSVPLKGRADSLPGDHSDDRRHP